MNIVIWLILAFVAGIVEAGTAALVSVWFCVGAICAAIGAAIGFSVSAQVITFLVISVILIFVTLPLCKKFRNNHKSPTNADRLIGEIGLVTEDVDPILGTGEIKVRGQRWSVQLRGDGKAKAGDTVKVEDIVGAHIVASLINEREGE